MTKTSTNQKQLQEAITAIENNDPEKLRACLEQNKDLVDAKIESDTRNNLKLIHLLAREREEKGESKAEEMLSVLTEYGAHPNEADNQPEGLTFLQLCASKNLFSLIDKVFESGARMDGEDLTRAAETALEHGHTALAKKLVVNGAQMNYLVASGTGDIDCLATFFDNSLNLRVGDNQLIEYGTMEMTRTMVKPFILACKNGQLEAAFFLLKRGADINLFILHSEEENCLEASALHWAAKHGHYELVKFLINYGASIHTRDTQFEKTAGDWALEAGHDRIHKYISYLQKK